MESPAGAGTATGIPDGCPFALKHPAPEVIVIDRADSGVKVRIRVWFPSACGNTQDDIPLCTRILPEFKSAPEAAGIQIPFPQRERWSGNEIMVKKCGCWAEKNIGGICAPCLPYVPCS